MARQIGMYMKSKDVEKNVIKTEEDGMG